MDNSIKGEVSLLLISFVTGILSGIIFDFFRAMRKIKDGRNIIWLQDIFFWLLETALVFFMIYKYNSGGIRFYIFIGLATGLIIYLLTVSRAVVFILEKTCGITRTIILFFVKIFLKVFNFLALPFRRFFIKTNKTAQKLKKRLKMY